MKKKDIDFTQEILEILENNSKYTDGQIAVMLDRSAEEVREKIKY